MNSQRPSPGVLVLTQSRMAAGLQLGFYVIFFGWFWYLAASARLAAGTPTIVKLFLWLAPLFSLPEIIRHVRVLATGETFTLDRTSGIIQRNGVQRALFSEVSSVQVRTIRDTDNNFTYRLSIVLTSEDKLRIAQSANRGDIYSIAEDLADILGVEITSKGR